MRNLPEYEYVHIDSDFILIGFTILHYKCYILDSYLYLSYSIHYPIYRKFELTPKFN